MQEPLAAVWNRRCWAVGLAAALLLAGACSTRATRQAANSHPGDGSAGVLRLATTTSTRDSGLLDVLLPVFERMYRCRVDVVAVGTGAALKLGEAGDADVLIVHAPEAEAAFMAAGHGVRREQFMYNQFVLLGPRDDPAGVRGLPPPVALRRIAQSKARFVSRGDQSGTHQKELALWKAAALSPQWDQYLESGQGMGPTLVMADQMRAYVLADMGTYLKFRDKIDLEPLAAPAQCMRNPYAVIVVDPEKHPRADRRLADALADFLLSPRAQQLIAEYRVCGEPLFHPLRLPAASRK